MTITREQVADLRPGDVVELRSAKRWVEGTVVRGPLYETDDGHLKVAYLTVRYSDGRPLGFLMGVVGDWQLTVVSRAPRPLYVNSDRTEPVPGDVVRDADDEDDRRCWDYIGNLHTGKPWARVGCIGWDTRRERDELPTRLRLIVDGATGQAVTS